MVKNGYFLILGLLVLLLSPVVFAEINPVDLVFKQGQSADIKVPCIDNNEYCGAAMQCNVTILKPDTSVLINNALMTRNVAYYNYTLDSDNTSTIGTYQLQVICTDGTTNGYELAEFQITSSGMSGIGKDTLVPAIVLIAILVFCAFMAWQLPEEEGGLRLLFIGFSLILLIVMIQYANLATNEDAVGLTSLLNTTYMVLLPVIIFVAFYFVIVKFLMPLLSNINMTYKERKEGKGPSSRPAGGIMEAGPKMSNGRF